MTTWRTKHDVLWASGPVEVRRYRRRTLARTLVRGPQRAALDEGFSLLAGYLFGRNEAGRVMDLVVPLLQQRMGGEAGATWSVFYTLPDEFETTGLPQPLGGRVELVEAPEATLATLRFTFYASSRKLARKEHELRSALAARTATAVGEPIYAFYSSPLVPPFMRRNEIWLEMPPEEEAAR